MSLAALLILGAGCGDDAKGPSNPGGEGGAAGEGGSGGSGGTGGAGGAGGSGGDGGGGGVEDPGPPWDEVGLRQEWRHQGFGEVFSLGVGDFLGDGTQQIAVGGRRPALLSADGEEVLWYVDWPIGDNLLRGGDNDWVEALASIRNERGSEDLLITRSLGGAALLDGRDGSEIWSIDWLDARFNFPQFTLFGDPEAPSFFPNYGFSAYEAATGEVAWTSPVTTWHAFVREARRGPGVPTGLFLVSEGEQMLGHGGSRWVSFPSFTAVSATGELLGSAEFRDGEEGIQPVAVGVADLDGAGTDSLLIAFFDQPLQALNPDGSLRWEKSWLKWGSDPTRTRITHILNRDLDGDGKDEILLLGADANMLGISGGEASLLVLDHEGNELYYVDFNRPVVQASVIDVDDGAPVLLLGIGTTYLLDDGEVLALRLDPELEDLTYFRYHLPSRARNLALLGSGEELEVVVGTDDGILRTTDLDGEERWDHHLGYFFSRIAAIPYGTGRDRIAFGDISGTLSLLDEGGAPLWHRSLSVGFTGSLDGLTTATFEENGDIHIVAAATAAKECCRGTLEVFTLEGEPFLERPLPGAPLALAAYDLDGDGSDELLVLEGMQSSSDVCRLRSYLLDGAIDWERPIAMCEYAGISIHQEGDGTPWIAVRTHPGILPAPSTLSVVERDGGMRWHHIEEGEGSNWVQATAEGLLSGGGESLTSFGFAALRDAASGDLLWRTRLPGRENPAIEDDMISARSSFGIAFRHGARELVGLTTMASDLFVLELGSGEILWSVFTETEENFAGHRHSGGPLVYVERTETTPAFLFTAQFDGTRLRSDMMAISMQGEIQGRLPLFSPSSEVVVAQRPGLPPAVVVKTLLGIHSVEVAPLAAD